MGMRISPSRRLGRLGLVILLVAGLSVVIGGCDPDGGRADLSGGARFEGLIVETALYFPGDDHNVVKLRGTYTGGRPFEADFLGYFNATGGSERWGGPISELFEEWPGTLVQYFSNGVLSYRPSWGMEWRPAWDLLEEGAGRGGVEDMPTNANDGAVVGPGERWSRTSRWREWKSASGTYMSAWVARVRLDIRNQPPVAICTRMPGCLLKVRAPM